MTDDKLSEEALEAFNEQEGPAIEPPPEVCHRCARYGREKPNLATEPHTCPYKCEINDDSTTLCKCCAECESECADDI